MNPMETMGIPNPDQVSPDQDNEKKEEEKEQAIERILKVLDLSEKQEEITKALLGAGEMVNLSEEELAHKKIIGDLLKVANPDLSKGDRGEVLNTLGRHFSIPEGRTTTRTGGIKPKEILEKAYDVLYPTTDPGVKFIISREKVKDVNEPSLFYQNALKFTSATDVIGSLEYDKLERLDAVLELNRINREQLSEKEKENMG